jgi:hypothetical protein
MAFLESEGHLEIVAESGKVIAIYLDSDQSDDIDSRCNAIGGSANHFIAAPTRRIQMPRLALTAWGVFEMARAAGSRPDRMVHAQPKRSLETQTV